MINKIKNNANKISRLHILTGFCFGVFTFIVLQNSATAQEVLNQQNNSSNSMTEFLNNKGLLLFTKNINESQSEYEKNFNMNSDYSLQKYISDINILENKEYIPSDLVKIDSEYIVDQASRSYLRQPANLAFSEMAKDFYMQFKEKFYLISAYRTYLDQATLFEYGCSITRCAKIGGSEHQLGLAVDIHLSKGNGYIQFSGEYLDRMNNNAYKYGYINTYRKGINIDGKMNEVWHRRYVGVPFATTLHKKDMSFAEYYNTTVI